MKYEKQEPSATYFTNDILYYYPCSNHFPQSVVLRNKARTAKSVTKLSET